MKRLILLGLILIFLFSFGIVFAQKKASGNSLNLTRIEQLVDKYISEKTNGTGGETALTGLSIYYGGLSDLQKRSVCKYFMTRIDKFHSDGDMKSALVLSDLYESFSPDPTDANYARLYYIRGEYAAMRSDTLTLKRQISSLVNFSSSDETEKEKYVTTLSTNLEEIRNYVPVDKTIEGTWVCDLQGNEYSEPYFILEVKQASEGKPVFILRNYTGFLSFVEKPVIFQEEYAFTNDSVYVAFSNEDLKNPSPLLNGLLRTYGNTYASIIGLKTARNTGSSLVGDLTGMATSMVADAVFDNVLAPRKYSYLLEFKLRKVNDWQMDADVSLSQVTVKGDNVPKYKDLKYHTLFTKIKREDNWFWYGQGFGSMTIPFDMDKEERKAFREGRKCPRNWENFNTKNIKVFNTLQTIKIEYLTEERLLAEGVAVSDVVNIHKQFNESRRRVVVGIELNQESKNLNVKKTIPAYPAERAGIKNGDIITHIDGYEVSTPQQFYDVIKSKLPYQKVVLTVERKKKKFDVTVETCLSL